MVLLSLVVVFIWRLGALVVGQMWWLPYNIMLYNSRGVDCI